jgi:hypothetical protein
MIFETVLDNPDLLLWPAAALVLFFSLLLGALFWVFRPGSKTFYKKMSLLPFSETPK